MSVGTLQKLGRSAAVAGMVGMTSVLMVFNSGPAAAAGGDATLIKILAKTTSILGLGGAGAGVAAAAPEADLVLGTTAAVCSTAYGCAALAAVGVGVGLYMTQDTWIPWLANEFGAPVVGQGVGTMCGNTWCFSVPTDSAPKAGYSYDGSTNAFTFLATSVTDTWNYGPGLHLDLTCTTPGGVSQVQHRDSFPGTFGPVGGSGPAVPAGSTVSFDIAGCTTLNVGDHDPANWGTLTHLVVTGAQNAPPAQGLDTYTWEGPTAGFDPSSRATQSRVNCTRPDGSTYQINGTVTAPGPLPADGLMVQVPTCQNGDTANVGAHGTCVTLMAGLPGALVDQSTSCAIQSDASKVAYPNCVSSACSYVIRVDGIACTVGRADCVDWSRVQSLDPSRVSCRFGPYPVDLGKCGFMERAYEPTGAPATGPNTDGNPRTWTGPGPQGQPTQATDPNPQTQPPPSDLPLPGTSVIPTPENADCWPSGWASLANPASWVLQPIKCAFTWAFVPSAAVQTNLVTDQLDRAGIAPSIEALSTAVGSLGGDGAGCAGPSIHFDIQTVHQVINPFSACTEPMSTVAGYAYALISVTTVIGGASKIISVIAHGFGYGAPPPTWQQGTLF